MNFKIIWDADWLENISEEYNIDDKIKIRNIINKVFKTKTGKELAEKMYLQGG